MVLLNKQYFKKVKTAWFCKCYFSYLEKQDFRTWRTFNLGIVNSRKQATVLGTLISVSLGGQKCVGNFEWCCHWCIFLEMSHCPTNSVILDCLRLITRGVDKSLARPGRKQVTVNKLRIYWTYSLRGSVHFLSRCSHFCKTLRKNSEGCPSNQVSAAAVTYTSDEKWRPFNRFFFQSREQVVVRRDQIRRTGWVIKTLEAQVGQFLLGCKCPVSQSIVVQ